MFERYTEKARRVIFFGRYEASQFGSHSIETEHLLLGLLREDKALAHRFLNDHAAIESIRKQVEAHTVPREKVPTTVDLPLSHECKRVLAYAHEEVERLHHKHIGTDHLLLGLLREEKSFAAELLHERGLRVSTVREEIARVPAEVNIITDLQGNLDTARRYLQALEEGATGEALAAFFDPEVKQTEFPNRLNPKGAKRDLPAILDAAERGKNVLMFQQYRIQHELASGDLVVLEVLWTGTVSAFQSLSPGTTLRAHFAVFLRFRNGKIIEQRNYDCFEPFEGA